MRLGRSAGMAGLLCLALAGCGGGGTAAGSGASPGGQAQSGQAQSGQAGSSVQHQARAVWLDYARCVRAHGHPGFPDPQVDAQGKATFAGNPGQVKAIGKQLDGTCGPVLRRLPAAAQGQTPVTPALLHQETLFAACLRRNGLPQWPDPRPDGSFPLAGTPYATMGKSGPVLTAFQACHQYDVFGGIEVTRP